MSRSRREFAAIVALLVGSTILGSSSPAPASPPPPLLVGVGRADLTPPTGLYTMGYVRSDSVGRGVHTRLFARAIVLEYGPAKVALVAADLGAIAGGLVTEAARRLRGRGFSEENILVSASHTHGGPTGYFNFSTYNTVFMTRDTPTEQNVAGARDDQLYTFMAERLTLAIRRADDNLGIGRLGWGSVDLLDVTKNRSIEAHLANHGIEAEFGEGSVAQDPGGARHTINPSVDVLRVEKLLGRRYVPVGMWSTFANHGTANPYDFPYYNADHHGPTVRYVEDAIRAAGRVPRGQDVVNAFGNTDEGDVSSSLDAQGPAHADRVGRRQAAAMLSAWKRAGRSMTSHPAIDLRWTRVCFCGQEVTGGAVDDGAVVGLPLFTGSEEGRGPLYEVTGVPFEGRRLPVANPLAPAQGRKIPVIELGDGTVPTAVPLMALRIGDRMIVSVPGEMTAAMGYRVRASVLRAASRAGVRRVVISGLANEYLQYFTTPEEYARQHYEGGSTLFGQYASNLLLDSLTDLSGRLATHRPAPEPHPFDPTNGVVANADPYPRGASEAAATERPGKVSQYGVARFAWAGGERGLDRPLDRPFITIERLVPGGARSVSTDLGLDIMWLVDDEGNYEARWHVPDSTPVGRYRFVVSANRYRLRSAPFPVVRSRARTVPANPAAVDSFACLIPAI